jgi:hypothetical protein
MDNSEFCIILSCGESTAIQEVPWIPAWTYLVLNYICFRSRILDCCDHLFDILRNRWLGKMADTYGIDELLNRLDIQKIPLEKETISIQAS